MQQLSVSSRYRIVRRLHVGGMAEVFLAVSEGTIARRVVIKRMLPELARLPQMRRRFAEEAQLLSRLAGPGLPAVYDAGEDEEGLFLIEQFIAGLSLRELLELEGPLAPAEVAAVLVQALGILSRLHAATDESDRPLEFVHRDLAPENLLLDPDGELWLLDLGIAKSRESQVQTQAGVRQGRTAYMAPELLLGRSARATSDLYALALVGAELAGATPAGLPTDGDTTPPAAIARLAAMEAAERVSWPPNASGRLREAIESLLALDPAKRPGHDEAAKVLSPLASGAALSRRVIDGLERAPASEERTPQTPVLPGAPPGAGTSPARRRLGVTGRKNLGFGLVAFTALAGALWALSGFRAPVKPPAPGVGGSGDSAMISDTTALLKIEVPTPGSFELYLDGKARGQVNGARGLRVTPGTHTLLLTEESTNRYYREDFLTRLGETRSVRFPLGWEGDQESTQQGEKEDE